MYRKNTYKRAQHEAVRNAVGWYYFTHDLLELTGEDSAETLDKLCMNSVCKLGIGREKYTPILDEYGNIQDDVIIFRLEENKYWVSTLYVERLMARLKANFEAEKIQYRDITTEWDMYSVQGPNSRDLLNCFLKNPVDTQKYFSICSNQIDDVDVMVARSGFTGELGYEIYVAPANKGLVEEKLRHFGPQFKGEELDELEVMVMTLPSEKGYHLMCDIGGISPFEMDPNVKVEWDRDFIGKEGLAAKQKAGITRRLVGFTIPGDNAHVEARNWGGPGAKVMYNGKHVGRVSKFTYSYTTEQQIGYALVDTTQVKIGDIVTINGYEATLTEKCWYDPENQRVRGI